MAVIRATIDRLEKTQAIVRLDDGQEIKVPVSLLPLGSKEGGIISLSFGDEASLTKERQEQAKALLNEILRVDTDKTDDASS
ncbi:MAG: DUF3006 domain-containing protein [Patescibacteria group bacterium]